MSDPLSVTQERLVSIRRELHRHPEPGFTEFWTTAFLAARLAEAGLSPAVGPAVLDRQAMGMPSAALRQERIAAAIAQGADPEWIGRMDGLTGIAADIRPDLPLHTIMRFDIDCVEVEESSDPDHFPAAQGFRSINPGAAHACGHDGHAAIGLGTALGLFRRRSELKHNVRILFQPAEEGCRGAAAMVSAGAAAGARHFLGAHIGVSAARDHALVCGTRGFLASTKFDVEYRGISAHAGFEPHAGRNSLLAAASAVLNLNAIPRHGEGASRITVGTLHSGSGRNVIPSYAKFQCETRGDKMEIDRYMFERAVKIIESTAAMYDQECSITMQGAAGTADSDPCCREAMRRAALEIPYFHEDLITDIGPGYASDDACTFLAAVQEHGGTGTYAQIGSALPAGHHSPRFDFSEALLAPSVELFIRTALILDAMD